jgi:hypothetical protein
MAQFNATLGDPFATREQTVKAMMGAIGRDTSDLTFTPASTTSPASLPDDPDVRIAWEELVRVYSEVCNRPMFWNTVQLTLSPGSGGAYYVTATADAENGIDGSYNTTIGNNIVRCDVLTQPDPDIHLVYRGEPGLLPRLFDTKSRAYGDFSDYGDVDVEVTYFLKWEYLPYVARKLIYVSACRSFMQRVRGVDSAVGLTQQDEDRARMDYHVFCVDNADANMHRDSAEAAEHLQRWA